MTLYIPEGTPPVIPGAIARVERRMPAPGNPLVRVGSRVQSEDRIAEGYTPQPPIIINVARSLGIPPALVERAMRREIQNKVTKGEVLARLRQLGSRACIAPESGVITAVDTETGYVTLAPDPKEFELFAAIRGVVMDVDPMIGIVIETPAAQVYGAFGVGVERSGVLRLLVTDPGEMLTPDAINAKSAYAILIGGSGITAAALRRAVKEQVRGVIVGGIDERELAEFLGSSSTALWRTGVGTWQIPQLAADSDPGLTILVTEGFGQRPMAQPIFDLLSEQDRQEALIEGATNLRKPLRRPRVVVPLSRSGNAQLDPPRPQLRAGAIVRLLDSEHLGQMGQVRTLPTMPRRIGSGVRVPAVEVAVEGSAPIWLPRTAVEVLA